MDYAVIFITAASAVAILFLLVLFVGWVKLRFEIKGSVKACEDVQTRAAATEKKLQDALDDWEARCKKNWQDQISKAHALAEAATLRIDGIAESFATMNAKAAAREREEKKRLKQESAEDLDGQVENNLPIFSGENEVVKFTPRQSRPILVRKQG